MARHLVLSRDRILLIQAAVGIRGGCVISHHGSAPWALHLLIQLLRCMHLSTQILVWAGCPSQHGGVIQVQLVKLMGQLLIQPLQLVQLKQLMRQLGQLVLVQLRQLVLVQLRQLVLVQLG